MNNHDNAHMGMADKPFLEIDDILVGIRLAVLCLVLESNDEWGYYLRNHCFQRTPTCARLMHLETIECLTFECVLVLL